MQQWALVYAWKGHSYCVLYYSRNEEQCVMREYICRKRRTDFSNVNIYVRFIGKFLILF